MKEPTTMNAHLYYAQYFGGPCDGRVVVATLKNSEARWSMPIATTNAQAGSAGGSTTDFSQAVYKQTRTCHLLDHGRPMIRYEYEFVGLEVAAPPTRGAVAGWLAFVKLRLNHLLQRNLWLPLPEGRPKRPGQATRLLTCPGRGLRLNSN